MTEKQRECILEIQELIMAINQVAEDHGLKNEFLSCIAIGFVDLQSQYTDEDGDERANMNLLSSFSIADEDELDDLLSYCVEAYRIEEEDKNPDTSNIDYWINLSNRDGSIN
tara:strand:+ start:394 stop:729 length:336 start_codon:yes stop_codon:yes gene_type:complete